MENQATFAEVDPFSHSTTDTNEINEIVKNNQQYQKGNFIEKSLITAMHQNFSDVYNRKLNSPTYKRINPITQTSEEIDTKEFKSPIKKPIHNKNYSSIQNIIKYNDENVVPENSWKPSQKKIEIKQSHSELEKKKSCLKRTEFGQLRRNPILDGEPEKQAPKKQRKDFIPSEALHKRFEKDMYLPAQRKNENNTKIQKSEINNLLEYKYAPDFKKKEISKKCTEIPSTQISDYQKTTIDSKNYKRKRDTLFKSMDSNMNIFLRK